MNQCSLQDADRIRLVHDDRRPESKHFQPVAANVYKQLGQLLLHRVAGGDVIGVELRPFKGLGLCRGWYQGDPPLSQGDDD